jgi:hypothetical protein
MPTISEFFGILIRMYWDDHPPPHFHALYGEHEAQYNIATLDITNGTLPRQRSRAGRRVGFAAPR